MPDPLAALGIFGQGANMILQNETNKKNRNFTREMYSRQRQDALSDWEMQNAYNSPAAQMERYKGAGLNPNLIYGQMTTASPVRQSSSSGGQASAPHIDTGSVIQSAMAGYEMQQRQASTDLLGKQLLIADEEIKYKQAQTLATLKGAGYTDAKVSEIMYNMGYKEYFKDITMKGKEASLDKTAAETSGILAKTQFTLDENSRQQIASARDFATAVERIAMSQAQRLKLMPAQIAEINQRIENLKKDGTLKDYEIQLNKNGFSKSDPSWQRKVLDIAEEVLGPGGWKEKGKRALKGSFGILGGLFK